MKRFGKSCDRSGGARLTWMSAAAGGVLRRQWLEGLLRSPGRTSILTTEDSAMNRARWRWSVAASSPSVESTVVVAGKDFPGVIIVIDGRLEIELIACRLRANPIIAQAGDLTLMRPTSNYRLRWRSPDGLAYVIQGPWNPRGGHWNSDASPSAAVHRDLTGRDSVAEVIRIADQCSPASCPVRLRNTRRVA